MKLAIEVYRQTAEFPKHEHFWIDAADATGGSICSEQHCWRKGALVEEGVPVSRRGSLLELQTQIMISQELDYLSEQQGQLLLSLASQIGRGLTGLINSLAETAAA